MNLRRTLSEPCLTALWTGAGQSQAKAEQTLAYWKLETELRLAADSMLAKDEEVDELNKYRDTLEEEMGDLTVTLFEEANEMVRVEKEARHRDHVLLKETQDKTALLQAELKALKEIVAHLRKNGGAPAAYVGAGGAGAAAASPSGKPVPAPQTSNAARPYDTRIFNELMQWKSNPAISAESEFMKRILREDVSPCMSFHPKTSSLSAKLLIDVQEGQLIVETAKTGSPEDVCALTLAKRMCAHRVKRPAGTTDGPEWLKISGIARNRLIALCELYRYLGYITKGLVKASIADIYWKVVGLRLDVNKARLGLGM